jgi:hypothetical protein
MVIKTRSRISFFNSLLNGRSNANNFIGVEIPTDF